MAHLPSAYSGNASYPIRLQGSARPLCKLKLVSQQARTGKPASSRVIVSELSEGDGAAHRSPLLTVTAKYEQQEVLRQALPVFGGTLILLSLFLGDSCDVGVLCENVKIAISLKLVEKYERKKVLGQALAGSGGSLIRSSYSQLKSAF